MMATEGTSGVQGYPLWDKDEEKSNVHKMEKDGIRRKWRNVQQLMKIQEIRKV